VGGAQATLDAGQAELLIPLLHGVDGIQQQ